MVAVSDLILAISNLMGAPDHGPLCFIQSILQQIGDISSLLWVVCISWTINRLTTLTMLPTEDDLRTLLVRMHIIIWGITLVSTILPLTTNSYGVAGGWCWIKGVTDIDIMWRYICFYGLIWVAIIYMIVIYVKVWKRLNVVHYDIDGEDGVEDMDDEKREMNTVHTAGNGTTGDVPAVSSTSVISAGDQQGSSEQVQLQRKQNNTLQRMKFYPLILLICYTFPTIRRVIDWATNDQTPYFLAVLHTFFAAIPGFLDAIVYGLTKDVKQTDKRCLNTHCGCRCAVEDVTPRIKSLSYDETEQNNLKESNDSDDDKL